MGHLTPSPRACSTKTRSKPAHRNRRERLNEPARAARLALLVGARAYLPEYAKKPVIVMNYPRDIKAFYMRVNDNGRTVAAMDVLAPAIGEIIGASQREERLEILDRSIAERGIDREHY